MKSAIAIVVALVLAPVAHAQVNCDAYEKIIAAYAQGFEPLLGKEANGEFALNVTVPKAGSCSMLVEKGANNVLVSCTSSFSEEAKARAGASGLLADAKVCLKDWKMAVRNVDLGVPEVTVLAAVGFRSTVTDQGFALMLQRFGPSDYGIYRVSLTTTKDLPAQP